MPSPQFLNSFVAVLRFILWEHASGNQIRVPIVVEILHQGRAMIWDRSRHKLANHATEVSRHQERLKARHVPGVQLDVYEPQEV